MVQFVDESYVMSLVEFAYPQVERLVHTLQFNMAKNWSTPICCGGIGKTLMGTAELIAAAHNFKKISVIAGVGASYTRNLCAAVGLGIH